MLFTYQVNIQFIKNFQFFLFCVSRHRTGDHPLINNEIFGFSPAGSQEAIFVRLCSFFGSRRLRLPYNVTESSLNH